MNTYKNPDEYLQSGVEKSRLEEVDILTLPTGVVESANGLSPRISTTGNGMYYLRGRAKIDTASASMPILELNTDDYGVDFYAVTAQKVAAADGSLSADQLPVTVTGKVLSINAPGTPTQDDEFMFNYVFFYSGD